MRQCNFVILYICLVTKIERWMYSNRTVDYPIKACSLKFQIVSCQTCMATLLSAWNILFVHTGTSYYTIKVNKLDDHVSLNDVLFPYLL